MSTASPHPPAADHAAGGPPVSLAPGTLLGGRYRLGHRIGVGGMAVIHRGLDERLDRPVAIKVLHAHLADDPDLLARFRTEARHAAALSHAGVVAVYDQGVEGLPYIVMELVEGPSLRDILLARDRLSPPEVLSVVVPVCRALHRAHAAGVVHRDVKPENVLVGPDGLPKVADFGIARALAATSHTATGALVGSVHYLAPELVDGRDATPASDQYALAVVLYELLTGAKPLPADSPMAVALRHAREPLPPPSAVAPGIPPAVDAVVARAGAIDPADRYPDLQALAEALEVAVGAEPAPVRAAVGDGRERTLVLAPPDRGHAGDPGDPREPGDRGAGAGAPAGTARRRRRPARAFVGMLLLVALLAGGAYGAYDRVIAPPTPLPAVVGTDGQEAREALAAAGFEVRYGTPVHHLEVPAGAVAAHEPPPGSRPRRGSTVELVLSRGPRVVQMPRVLGLSEEEALTALAAHSFDVALNRSHSDTVPRGQVQAQAPDPGTQVEQGARVDVNVSLGIEQVRVPEVVGTDVAEATAAIEQARLRVEVTEVYSDEVPEAGQVIEQSLPAGRQVDKGSTVAVTVSRGPETIAVPAVEGQALERARQQLAELGLEVRVIETARPRFGPFRRGEYGRVEVQDPQAGTRVQRGARVDLYTYSRAADEGDG